MTDISSEVTSAINTAETEAGVVVDHAISFTDVIQTELGKAKTVLTNLQSHSAASQAGNLISNAVVGIQSFIENIEVAIGVKQPAPPDTTPAAPVVVEPAPVAAQVPASVVTEAAPVADETPVAPTEETVSAPVAEEAAPETTTEAKPAE